jgi:hypothetical protein
VLRACQDAVLDSWIVAGAADREEMTRVFGVMAGQPFERLRARVATVLAHNDSPVDFVIHELEPAMCSWSGSAVSMCQREVHFQASLNPLCRGVRFLRQHLHLEQRIAPLQKWIQREKRCDIVEDRSH